MIRSLSIWLAVASCVSIASGEAFVVNPETSFVGVDVTASPPHNFTVELKKYDASIQFSEGSPNAARFAFRFADLRSDKESRDKKMRQWMDVARYPDVVFDLQGVELDAEGRSRGYGTLSMHGLPKRIDVLFQVSDAGDALHLSGEADIDYHDWGLETITLLFFKVKPELHVRFDLVGRLVP